MDGIQTLLVIVIVTLTILLIVVGVQVILIFTDVRRTVKRLNSILEDSILGGGLIRPEKLTGILELFKRKKKSETREQGNLQSEPPPSG
ncbi:hypothetical protein A2V80_00375 [Candidatus Woesebacteria bacterium RBG_16_39_8b]|uniref:Uncharacterized protein n=1 Tax=Candidatus Woesebacteria bacterium RBG_16_39_8b TaxID=1802482 RepID=A0A1F7X7U0_9BACT|nr:MAG: hypothetical protein A2V80_00375 [Candidatus Woesebacteria bacterium RBG_16_39_8b]